MNESASAASLVCCASRIDQPGQGTSQMTEWQTTADPLVLHVIPTPLARGAQREARALADQLNDPGVRSHRVLTLFDGPDEVRSDFSLHGAGGAVAARGYSVRMVPKLRSALRRLDPVLVVAHGGDPLKYLVPAMTGRRRPDSLGLTTTHGRIDLLDTRGAPEPSDHAVMGAQCHGLIHSVPRRFASAPLVN